MQRAIWITKQHWLMPGPMTYMGLLNARAFAENDVETDFFVRANKHFKEADDTKRDLVGFYGLPVHQNFNVHCISDTKSWQRNVYNVATEKIIAYYEQGDDIIVATRDYGALAMLLKLKKKYPKLKVLYESHNFFINLRHLDKRTFSLSRMRTRWVERHQLFKADGLICLTEHQRALYQHWFPQLPTIALPLGCLDFPEHPALEQRRLKRRIAYIGHLYDYKGLELFFKLAQHLQSAQIGLHVYGGHEAEVLSLQNRAEREGLGDTLCFKPFIEPKVLHEILQNEISIGLVPLQDTFYNRYLTCPVKVLDFLAHGLPIIASELPSVRDLLRETGHYCDSRNAAEFAEQAGKLLDDAEAYEKASRMSYRRAGELHWRHRAKHLLEFAQRLSVPV